MHWARQIAGHGSSTLAGLVEPDSKRRADAAEQLGQASSATFAGLDEALDAMAGEVDAVLDVTPPAMHRGVAEATFASGLALLSEKPLADDWASSKAIVQAGVAADRPHMVTQNYRFSAMARTLRRLVGEGVVGTPGQCDVRFYQPWTDLPGTHYVTEPYMLINDMMVHHFDLARYILGVEPVAVTAHTWRPRWSWHAGDDAHAIVIEFEGGLTMTHTASGCAVGEQTDWNGDWRIEGDRGSVSWSGGRLRHVHAHRAEPRMDEVISLDDTPPGESAILDAFHEAVFAGAEPECSAVDNLQTVRLAFAAIESAKRKRRVELAEFA